MTDHDQAAPQERGDGERLATLPRDGPRGERLELRVSLDEYEGHPYVSIRVWAAGWGGGWIPTKAGCTIRVRELASVQAALRLASRRLGGSGPPKKPPRHHPLESGRGSIPTQPVAGSEDGSGFDEFDD